MFRINMQSGQTPPRFLLWQARASRIPRWGWALIGVAVILPIVVLLVSFAVVAVVAGAVMLTVVAGVLAVRNVIRRLAGGPNAQLARREPFTSRDVIVVERIDHVTK